MAVVIGITSAGAWGIFQTENDETKVDKKEVTGEDSLCAIQKAVSQERTRSWTAKLVAAQTPPVAGEILTVDTWTGIIDSAKKTADVDAHFVTYDITASRKDAAELIAYDATPGA